MTIQMVEGPQGQINLTGQGPAGGLTNIPGPTNFGGHIITGAQNAAPTATAGAFWAGPAGSALLPGTVTGNDNTGRVFFLTGVTATRGDLLLITFAQPFVAVPAITITSVSPTLASAGVYVTPSNTGFVVGTAGPMPVSATFNFFYSALGITG